MGLGGEDAPWDLVERMLRGARWSRMVPSPGALPCPEGSGFPPAVLPCCALPVDAIAGEAAVGAEAVAPYEHGTGRGGVSKRSVWEDIIRESGQN